jgi:hypothetical protein
MGCFQVHDFIRGTTIAFPRALTGKPVSHKEHDILRPNPEAAALVLRHVEVLGVLGARPEPETRTQ